jgi:hypothetical protein
MADASSRRHGSGGGRHRWQQRINLRGIPTFGLPCPRHLSNECGAETYHDRISLYLVQQTQGYGTVFSLTPPASADVVPQFFIARAAQLNAAENAVALDSLVAIRRQ